MKKAMHYLVVTVILLGLGGCLLWISLKPRTAIVGYVRVQSVTHDPLTGEVQPDHICNFHSRMEVEAFSMLTSNVLERVADDLSAAELPDGFELKTLEDLKAACVNETLRTKPVAETELIGISLLCADEAAGQVVVNSLMRNYSMVSASGESIKLTEDLRNLKVEKDKLLHNLQSRRERMARTEGDRESEGTRSASAVEVEDLQWQIEFDKELLGKINRRIYQLELASGQSPRIRIFSRASADPVRDPRSLPIAAAALLFFVVGYLLALTHGRSG